MTSRGAVGTHPLVRWGARLIAVGLGLALAVGAAELGVRALIPAAYWRARPWTDDFRLDPQLGWAYKPRLDVAAVWDGQPLQFRTNDDGISPGTAQRAKPDGLFRVMIFGDSIVAGRAVPQDQTVSAHLERLLRARGIPAEVLNCGVPAYSTDQSLLSMERLLPLYRPDLVIYGFCRNDVGGNTLRVAYEMPKPIFRRTPDGTLELLPPDLRQGIPAFNRGIRDWIQHSAVYRLLQPWLLELRAQLFQWEERFLMDFTLGFYHRPDVLEALDWELFRALLARMAEVSEAHGARFLFYAHPELAEVWDPHIQAVERRLQLAPGAYDRYAVERRVRQAARLAGVRFCPMVDPVRAQQARGPFHLLPRDPHSNAVGYTVTAEVLVQCLAGGGLLPPESATMEAP